MKIAKTLKYQFLDCAKVLLVITCVSFVFHLLPILFARFDGVDDFISSSGYDLMMLVFAFVLGFSMVSEGLPFMLQCGVSRKTQFVTKCVSTVAFSVILATIYFVVTFVSVFVIELFNFGFRYEITSLFAQIYSDSELLNSWNNQLITWVMTFAGSMFTLAFGSLVGTLNYRLTKTAKMVIFLGVPVTLLIVFPLIDLYLFQGELMGTVAKFIATVFGILNGQFMWGFGCLCLLFVVISVALYFVMRKIPVKK